MYKHVMSVNMTLISLLLKLIFILYVLCNIFGPLFLDMSHVYTCDTHIYYSGVL